MESQYFAKVTVEGVTLEEVNGQIILTGLDADARRILRNFVKRPAKITVEPIDTKLAATSDV